MENLALRIGHHRAKPCPSCKRGRLMYPMERRRGSCLACQIKARGISRTWPYQRIAFRIEAEAYDEGIYDDD